MTKSLHYSIGSLLPYVNWIYFFHAWGMPPRFASLQDVHDCAACQTAWVGSFPERDRAQADEAFKLYRDARLWANGQEGKCRISARFGLYPAWSNGDDIVIRKEDETIGHIPCLRQQRSLKAGEPCLCLSDFISPRPPQHTGTAVKDLPRENVAGIFCTAAQKTGNTHQDTDDYKRMLTQTKCDRLAEAAAEKLHEEIRRDYWGYAPEERLSPRELFAEKYEGRRPAVGYPSMPDQSIIFVLDDILNFKDIGISLTESGMMQPHAAVAGLIFGHPAARHFGIGPIDDVQLCDYAQRRHMTPSALRRFLTANLSNRHA